MNIDLQSLDSRLGHELSQRQVDLTQQASRGGNQQTPFKIVERNNPSSPTPRNPPVEKRQKATPFISCRLDTHEKELTEQLTAAMFQVRTAEEQRESFKNYIRSLEFLNVVLVPLKRSLYSSVLIQDLPLDTLLPAGRMKSTLNSEMTLYGIGRAAGLKKLDGDEVQEHTPLKSLPLPGIFQADSIVSNSHNAAFTALYCHRNERQESINLCEVDELLASLPEATKKILSEPRFKTSNSSLSTTWSQAMPALTFNNGRQELINATHNIKSIDQEANQALFDMNALLNSGKTGRTITLQPGDALVVNNTRVLHGSNTHQTLSRLWLQSLSLTHADNSTATNTRLRSI